MGLGYTEVGWPGVLDRVREKSPSLGMVIAHSWPIDADDTTITVGIEYAFHRAEAEKRLAVIQACADAVYAKPRRIIFTLVPVEDLARRRRGGV